jgi:hypothetical protein
MSWSLEERAPSQRARGWGTWFAAYCRDEEDPRRGDKVFGKEIEDEYVDNFIFPFLALSLDMQIGG